MSPKDITSIAIKFFGIYLLVSIVIYSPSVITTLIAIEKYQEENFGRSLFVAVSGAFILLGVVVSLILFRIANSITTMAVETTESSSSVTQDFLLQVLGTYFVVSGISTIPVYALSAFKGIEPDAANVLRGAGYIFQIAVGCYLLIKPVAWRQWLNYLRGRS